MGPPGSGKGTQAQILAERVGVPQIATGDILRAAVQEGTPLGREARDYMDRGALVPDEVVIGIIRDRTQKQDCSAGYILDGFPRTIAQAEALDQMLTEAGGEIDFVVSLLVNEEELVRRLSGRRTCRSCGAGFHIYSRPPQKRRVCDLCGGPLYQRDDDREETIRERLLVYRRQTQPLIEYYRGRGILKELNGSREIGEIQEKILEAVGVI